MPDSDDTLRLANDLRIACQLVSRRVRFEGTHEVPPHQFSVLARLRESSFTPGGLAQIERVSKPSMSRTVGCLADGGLVEVTDDPSDGRQKIVTLTEAGRAVIERTIRERDNWMLLRVQRLDADQRALLRQATDLIGALSAE